MRFSFTDEQLELRAAAADVLASTCPISAVRAQRETPSTSSGEERWRALAELGATGLLAPERAGGVGLSDVELIGVVEEAGRFLLPEPLGMHAGVAVPLLAATGQHEVLRSAAAGETVIGVGGIDVDPDGPVVARHDGDAQTDRIEGAREAGWFLLATASALGLELHLVAAADCEITPTPTLDPTRALGSVRWVPSSDTLLSDGPDALLLIERAASRAATYSAAALVGVSSAMLELTATYAVDRQQFGRPIGSFQAVKHLLADVRIRLEFARPAVYRAAWSLATDADEIDHDAALAKALSSELATVAATNCLQVHGAIGYTWEHDLSLYLKRAWALAAAHGDGATQRARALGLGLGL